ncbi:MAG: RNA polymerase sigma factor [Armatimonadetes bacterium]|nr:RNA polymerase sigma factor [Armatimonadota bacterium]
MEDTSTGDIGSVIAEVYKRDSPRALATLIRLLGNFDVAEDALQDAFAVALRTWPEQGVPANPRAWLVSTARFKAIDALRRAERTKTQLHEADSVASPVFEIDESGLEDDILRLVFVCCHPVLSLEAQVALTLREVCGLTTEEVAKAYLTTPTTVAQRIVRAKNKLRESGVPYEVPREDELPTRQAAVLRVVYLLFNEGYYATSGEAVTRSSLSLEAIRLARLLAETMPSSEVDGLLALMLLQESRRAARTSPDGEIVLLDDQDRSLWDKAMVAEGMAFANRSFATAEPGFYALQAAIAAVHASSPSPDKTDWSRIVLVYDALLRVHPSTVAELNRAVAVAMAEGPGAGLALIDSLLAQGGLADYGLAHAARADMCRRLQMFDEARSSYARALELASQEPERRFLEKRILEVSKESVG